jgi:hypothetical protein
MFRAFWTLTVTVVIVGRLFAESAAALRWLDHADVKADFHRTVEEKHDTRFLAVLGMTRMIPGSDYRRPFGFVERYGYRDIEGTSDVGDQEHARLCKKALVYAEQYNEMLMRYLYSHK